MTDSLKAYSLTDEMAEAASQQASVWQISSQLHEHDQLLGYFINQAGMAPKAAVEAYYSGGRSDANSVITLMNELGVYGKGMRILEFASGYGRVTRHLKGLAPNNSIYASDIHGEACQFIMQELGTVSFQASSKPVRLQLPGKYDFIFVLSLFSHLPQATFGGWLTALYELLLPGGHLMFTTHGEAAMRRAPEFFAHNFNEEEGFGFRPESDQHDISANDYGTATVSVAFVSRAIAKHIPDAELKSMVSETWFGLQDQWVVRKPLRAQGSGK